MKDSKKINSYLSFILGDELFAAHVNNVLNILELTKITEVPQSPEYMRGVINLRGTVLPIVDLRVKFGMSATDATINTVILVLEVNIAGEKVQIGILADEVKEVFEATEDMMQAPPHIGSKYKSEFIVSMIKMDEEFIMLLDMNMVFSIDEVKQMAGSGTQTRVDEETQLVGNL